MDNSRMKKLIGRMQRKYKVVNKIMKRKKKAAKMSLKRTVMDRLIGKTVKKYNN